MQGVPRRIDDLLRFGALHRPNSAGTVLVPSTVRAMMSFSRWDRVWVALPYVLLVVCGLLAWVSGDLVGDTLVQAGLAFVAVALWHGWWVIRHPHWLAARLAPMAAYFIGLLALTDFLTSLTFTFFPLYLVCYPMAFVALPGAWAYVGVGTTAVVALIGPPLDAWTIDNLVIGLGAAALVSVAGGAIRALEAETVRRREAMASLERAHADLERALAQNLALQERLSHEAREAGIAAERARLAGEIHDTLAADLTGIVSQLEALDAHLGSDHPLRVRVRASADLARESLQEARRSVGALRPGSLIEARLPAALTSAIARFEASHALPVQLHLTGAEVDLPAPVEDVLIRAAQESLVNVDRHAGATTAHVTLSFLGDTVVLDVADDGAGFDPAVPWMGHGLNIMRERVGALGGRVEVASSPDRGTNITVLIPLAQESAHDRK